MMLDDNDASRTRLTLELDAGLSRRMIMEIAGIKTQHDFYNQAASLLEWAVNEAAKGRSIASFDLATGSRNILSMPILERAASSRDQD